MSHLTRMLLALLALAFTTLSAFGQTYEDKRFGFELKPPREWSQVPIKANEEYIIAKFLAKKNFFYTDPDLKVTYEHRPELQVIAFLSEKYRKDAVEQEVEKDGDKVRIVYNLTNPFDDYPDFLKETYSGAGFYIAEEEETEIDGMKVTQYLVKIEKLSNGPKRIVTWVFHTGDIDFAVQIECFESAWKELRSSVTKTMKSFEEIERTEGSIVQNATTSGLEVIIEDASDASAPERRRQRQIDRERDLHEQALAVLPEDWTVIDDENFLVLNHVDKKDAQKLIEQGNAVYLWCEKTFPFLIDETDYLRRPIIRICKDWDELATFAFGGRSSGWIPKMDMATYKDTVGIGSWQYSYMTQQFASHWLNDHDAEFLGAMPSWMRYGLEYNLLYAKHKGKKLELIPSDWEKMGLREEIKAGTAHTPQEIFQAGEDFYDSDNSRYEAAALMRYLLVGKGAKDKQTKHIVREYYLNMKAVVDEIDAEEDGEDYKAPETEEEEDAMFKERQQRYKARQDQIIEETFNRTFANWTKKDWDKFEKYYFKSIK